jgi:NitT/TauT family transport system substrate-binding protein
VNSSTIRAVVIGVLVLAGLFILRNRPWEKRNHLGETTIEQNSHLTVGFLPVTCHLTCPVTDFASKTTTTSTRFESQRFTDFPTMVETMKAGRLDATFMIVPLAMKLREQGLPVKICYLGHRDGSTIMVPKASKATSLRDLKGKTVAIPSKYSNQNLVFHKLMEDQGLEPDDIKFVEMPPPDMPAALQAGAVDGYFVGEPFAARAEMDGTGRVLYHAKDIWPQFISCSLVVTEDLIHNRPNVVKDLVRGIAESGEWAETHRLEAGKLVAPYFRQDAKLVQYVLTEPPDRVSYRQLTPKDDEMEKIRDMGIKLGVLTKKTPMSELIDRDFIPKTIKAANIVVPAEPVKP